MRYSHRNKFDLVFILIMVLSPFVLYSFRLVPRVKKLEFFGIIFEIPRYQDLNVLIWIILVKLVPITILSTCFIYIRRRVSFFLLLPLVMYLVQLIAAVNTNSNLDTMRDWYVILPVTIVAIYFLTRLKKRLNRSERAKKKKQQELQNRLVALRHQALNAQMSPHFINNLLLSIYDSMEHGDMAKSMDGLGKFSKLVNLVLRSTKSDMIPLSEELEMAELYMQLQQDRFDNAFEYDLKIDGIEQEDLEYTKVPPMILQPLIENAISHGLRGLDRKGELKVGISIDGEYLHCVISDNGEGLSASKERQKWISSGISIKNINERLNIIDDSKKEKELVKLEDRLDENGKIIGAKSQLRIPLIQL